MNPEGRETARGRDTVRYWVGDCADNGGCVASRGEVGLRDSLGAFVGGVAGAVAVIILALVVNAATYGGIVRALGGVTPADVAAAVARHPGPAGPPGAAGAPGPPGPPGPAGPPAPTASAAATGSSPTPGPELPTVLGRRPTPVAAAPRWSAYVAGDSFNPLCDYRIHLVTPAMGPVAGSVDLSAYLTPNAYLYPAAVTAQVIQAVAAANGGAVAFTINSAGSAECAAGQAQLNSTTGPCLDTQIEERCP